MDNVQKHKTCNNIPSSQTFKSYFMAWFLIILSPGINLPFAFAYKQPYVNLMLIVKEQVITKVCFHSFVIITTHYVALSWSRVSLEQFSKYIIPQITLYIYDCQLNSCNSEFEWSLQVEQINFAFVRILVS
jgi:hypothetical protein